MSDITISYKLDLEPQSAWVTVTPSNVAKSAFFYVQEAGEFFAHEKYYTRRSGLASYLLKFTVGGGGQLEYGGKKYSLSPGDFFWIDCMNEQYYHTSDCGDWHTIWVHFYGAASKGYYERFMAVNNDCCVAALPPRFSMEQEIRRILKYYENGRSGVEADIKCSELIVRLLTTALLSALDCSAGQNAPECVKDAAAYLSSCYSERITLDDIAKRCSMNKYYFQKLFKKHLGYTPNEYLIISRINHAKELLRSTDMTVNEIAMGVGVENVSHFINLFKKHEGTTPNAYRSHWRSEGVE